MISFYHVIISVILYSLLQLAYGKISVYNYDELPKQYQNSKLRQINFSKANFGFVPSGKSYVEKIYLPEHFSDECKTEDVSKQYLAKIDNNFMLIQRGNCNFVTKAMHAQDMGAKGVVIMDNQTRDYKVIMADNGYGYKVKIPTVLISFEDGQLLKQAIQNSGVDIKINIFFQNLKTQKVDLVMWLKANSRMSKRLVAGFEEYYNKIKDYVNLSIVYQNQVCKQCEQTDCYENKTFCTIPFTHEKSATGREIMDQQIREKIIFDYDINKWFPYMLNFDRQCQGNISQFKQCGSKIMQSVGLDSNTIQNKLVNSKIRLLKEDSDSLLNAGIRKFPSVTINREKISGQLNGEYIFDDICNTLAHPPQVCNVYTGGQIPSPITKYYWTLVFVVIVVGSLIFALIFICYRRYVRRKMKAEMADSVNEMVSKYIQFYSQRQK